ncbi:hexosaminidase D [Neodiprion pinetum]|uniref:beta-N-acetylhexosaminidase n=1 Tax=Neodiprion lecontei TaxID=441921 RepID=A0A6J0BPH7_NEOLC|nr:hexosaminidase D [Neodiprion lecontei]XP_046411372.1 hexosaminidase D-like [Neodiprion fabricii]XP_046466956.1 hexosaminidase D-like [Neodiprion pinetum]XP_046604202.1 hexosaminidase D-like [Neodiprion virginianus]
MDALTFGSHRLVHLDLKGAPPRVSYLEKLFPLLRSWGATGLLLEWEDTFPYNRELTQIGSNGPNSIANGYTMQEARQILQIAGESGLAVVPLVQTFGHMEFVLKHDEWRSLREVELFPSSMCPSNPATLPLVKSLIRQIVSFHPDIQYLHIGADEVWHMGLCSVCIKRATSSKHGKSALFLEHVLAVAQHIQETYPYLKVIIWDDMLRNIDVQVLNEHYIGKYVEPMIWHYNSRETFCLPVGLWDKYSVIFSNIWAATAFKGATGSCQHIPVIQHHISNHERWLEELSTHVNKVCEFRGTAFTGWSRYDHYATMCELLPTAIPSLVMCLKVWLHGYSEERHLEVAKSLGYVDHPLHIVPQQRPAPIPNKLLFPGWQLAVGIEWFLNFRTKFHHVVDSDQIATWMNPWQIANNYTNPMQLGSLVTALSDLLLELSSLEGYIRVQMEVILFQPTLEEWTGTHIYPLKNRLKQLKQDAENQLKHGCRV